MRVGKASPLWSQAPPLGGSVGTDIRVPVFSGRKSSCLQVDERAGDGVLGRAAFLRAHAVSPVLSTVWVFLQEALCIVLLSLVHSRHCPGNHVTALTWGCGPLLAMKHHASSVKDTVLELQTASVLADSNVPTLWVVSLCPLTRKWQYYSRKYPWCLVVHSLPAGTLYPKI